MTDTYRPPVAPVIPKAEQFVPHSYLLGRQFTKCLRCDSEYENNVFSLVRHYMAPGQSAPVKNVTPTEVMSMDLPVYVATMKPKTIPVCGKCYCTLPPAKQGPTVSEANWSAAMTREAELNNKALMEKRVAQQKEKDRAIALAEARKDRLEDIDI